MPQFSQAFREHALTCCGTSRVTGFGMHPVQPPRPAHCRRPPWPTSGVISDLADKARLPPKEPQAEAERDNQEREFQYQSNKLCRSAWTNQLISFANVIPVIRSTANRRRQRLTRLQMNQLRVADRCPMLLFQNVQVGGSFAAISPALSRSFPSPAAEFA